MSRTSTRALFFALIGTASCTPKIPASNLGEWTMPPTQATPALTVRIEHSAIVAIKERQGAIGTSNTEHDAPVSVLVIEHPTQGLVLIDAGYPRRTLEKPNSFPGTIPNALLKLRMQVPIADALPDIGQSAEQVNHVLITHLHTDHAGGVEDLPNARIWVDPEEWLASQRKKLTKGIDPTPYQDRAATMLQWTGEPYGPFPNHVDVFKDGSIIALRSPGHTVGSTMYLINNGTKRYLFTGDVAWTDAGWKDGAKPKGLMPRTIVEWDWRENLQSLHALHQLSLQEPDIRIISGHEPSNLTELPPWPQVFP